MSTKFLDVKGLTFYDAQLKGVVGGSLEISGGSVILKSVSGATLSTQVLPIPKYSNANGSRDGLMSSVMYTKLDGISAQANRVEASSVNGEITIDGAKVQVYQHPTYAPQDSGLYKISVDTLGHVNTATRVGKSDITALGIPAQDTTYPAASASRTGLMTSEQYSKLSSVSTGAQPNKIERITLNGTGLPINSKTVNLDLTAYAKKSEVAAGINYRGSVKKFSELPSSPKAGDMYNITEADKAHGISAGVNVVWDGKGWDPMAPMVNIDPISNEEINKLF